LVHRKDKITREEKGATAIEVALILSVLLTLVFGAIEFATTLWQWNTMTLAVEQAGRYIMVNHNSCKDTSCGIFQLQAQFTGLGYSTAPSDCTTLPGGIPATGNVCVFSSTPSPQTNPATIVLGAIYAYGNIIVPLSSLVVGSLSGPFTTTSQATFPLD
jgi:Flp pilus assembly protein TadG